LKRRALAPLAALVAVAGCADLFGFEQLNLADAGGPDSSVPDVAPDVAPDAATDATIDAGPDVTGCQSVRWPGEPDASSNAVPTNYDLAIRHVHLTSTEDGGAANFGFDLDRKCTVDLASASCQPANPSEVIPDNPGGVDNESIDLINTLIGKEPAIASALGDDALNALIDAGQFSVLIRISGLQSDQHQTSKQGLSIALQAAPHLVTAPPQWDGLDRWQVAASDTAEGLDGGSNYPAAALFLPALVNDGTLVATGEGPETLTLVLPTFGTLTGVLPIKLSQVVVTGKLVLRGDGQYDMTQGLIAGRWAAADALEAIASLSYDGGALCAGANAFIYDFLTKIACPKRDINATGFDDDSHACDAFSVVVAFDAVATEVSNIPVPDPVSATPCADAGLCSN
jgi:hypothetical protein